MTGLLRSDCIRLTLGLLAHRCSQRIVNITKLPAFFGKFLGEREDACVTGPVGGEPPLQFLQALAVAKALPLEVIEPVLQSRPLQAA